MKDGQISDDLKVVCMRVLIDHLAMDPPQIYGSTRLAEDLDMDSLDLLEFRYALENELGIKSSNRQASKIKTIDDLLKLVHKLSSAKGESPRLL